MAKWVVLVGGPGHGQHFQLQPGKIPWGYRIQVPDYTGEIDVTSFGDAFKVTVPSVHIAVYEPRRMMSSGHICHDDSGQAIFEYVETH